MQQNMCSLGYSWSNFRKITKQLSTLPMSRPPFNTGGHTNRSIESKLWVNKYLPISVSCNGVFQIFGMASSISINNREFIINSRRFTWINSQERGRGGGGVNEVNGGTTTQCDHSNWSRKGFFLVFLFPENDQTSGEEVKHLQWYTLRFFVWLSLQYTTQWNQWNQ